jgi:hypothetical protein
MAYLSDVAAPAETAAAVVAARRHRRHYRQKIQNLAYVNLDHANGGIIRNLSEAGIAIQAVAQLRVNQPVYLRFELLSPRLRVEATGRVAWADSTGQVGVEFLAVPQRSQRLLKDWLFTHLLVAAHSAAWDSIFIHRKRGEEATELLFSCAPRPAIQLEPEETSSPKLQEREGPPGALHLAWCPVPISPRTLSWLVDGLILLSAVLLFSATSLAMTHVLPAWPVALVLALGVISMFTTLYWLLFVVWMGATPGARLAQFASSDSHGVNLEEEDTPRFR